MREYSALILGLCLAACSADGSQKTPDLTARAQQPQQADDPSYQKAGSAVQARLSADFQPEARNVILFIGDGMGVSTVTAARIYAGQKRGLNGESHKLDMEQLPYAALSRTYSHDYQVPDSAATATAMLSGVRTKSRTVGVTAAVAVGNCASQAGHETDSLFDLAERRGLATGIVSTARLTHATPAAAYAESVMRDWEDDTQIGSQADGCKDIARQLIDWPEGNGLEVALGGGRRHFRPQELSDPEYPDQSGRRSDERDLEAAWTAKSDQHQVIHDRAGFQATEFATQNHILGLFEPSHMQYELDRVRNPEAEPSLAELTEAALTRLSQQAEGYVLLVEGGRIDHAHHGVNAARALEDTDAFDQAIAAALRLTDPSETLIVVTADHSHTMTMAGYPRRNNPILGKVVYETGALAKAADGLPYTTLSYANGQTGCRPGETGLDCTRRDLSQVDTEAADYLQTAGVFLRSETHGGEDVPVFASGPGAELVRGVMDQNELFHIMGFASGLTRPVTPES